MNLVAVSKLIAKLFLKVKLAVFLGEDFHQPFVSQMSSGCLQWNAKNTCMNDCEIIITVIYIQSYQLCTSAAIVVPGITLLKKVFNIKQIYISSQYTIIIVKYIALLIISVITEMS